MPVWSNVPSWIVVRLSVRFFENVVLIPSLGSTAFSWPTSEDQPGWARSACVKMPVPAPILVTS